MLRLLIASFIVVATVAHSAVLYTETWDADDAGWQGSSGDATVSYDGTSGNPAGSLEASFTASLSSLTDSFYADATASSASFVGDYTGLTGFSGWRFDFLANTVLPSDMIMRLNGGGPTYMYNVKPQVTSVGAWSSVYVSSSFSDGWFGGSQAAFELALGSVQWLEIRFSTSGTGAQVYHMDNFEVTDEDPPVSGIPEPASGLLLAGGAMLYLIRWRKGGFRLATMGSG